MDHATVQSGAPRSPTGNRRDDRILAARRDALTIADLNAKLKSASAEGKRVAFEYSSDSRAIVRFDRKPAQMEVDGAPFPAVCVAGSDCTVLLPPGAHRVVSR